MKSQQNLSPSQKISEISIITKCQQKVSEFQSPAAKMFNLILNISFPILAKHVTRRWFIPWKVPFYKRPNSVLSFGTFCVLQKFCNFCIQRGTRRIPYNPNWTTLLLCTCVCFQVWMLHKDIHRCQLLWFGRSSYDFTPCATLLRSGIHMLRFFKKIMFFPQILLKNSHL